MFAFCAALALLALTVGGQARQLSATLKPHYSPLRPAPSDDSLTLTFALPSTDMDGLHAALMDVSDPTSPKYGKHLSKAEVETLVAPPAASVQAVTDWLSQHNLTAQAASPAGDMLRVVLPVEKANALLAANYTEFRAEYTGEILVRTLSYAIPDDVDPHIKFIYPTSQFIPAAQRSKHAVEVVQPSKAMLSKRVTPPAICAELIDPECLQDLYNIPNTTTLAPGNSLAVAAYLNEIATEADLQFFFMAFRPDIPTAPTFTIVSLDGGITSGDGTFEASLDIDYTVGLAPDVPTTFVSDGDSTVTGFIDMANFLAAQDDPPLVLTVSYGFNESDFNGAEDIANTLCDAYAQLGARGTSVFFCSGDNGVYSFSFDSECDATEFGPTFPSTCPFITSVGGTQSIPETAAPFSGGGFSNFFARPSYQDAAVSAYLTALGSTNAGLFNTSGRGFPDVSAQSVDFVVRANQSFVDAEGTSASTPTFASVVALLNGQRLLAGLPALGFINPLLYAQGVEGLNDVTTGSNPGCGAQGFPATEGWDPVTGLGTPDFDKLLNVVMSAATA